MSWSGLPLRAGDFNGTKEGLRRWIGDSKDETPRS